MKLIDVSTPKHPGLFAMVDDEDYDRIAKYKWTADQRKNVAYAVRVIRTNGKQRTVRLHQFVMETESGQQVDHIDGNGLNNQKANLRLCNHSQNAANVKRRRTSNTTSRYKGVVWNSDNCCWCVYLKCGTKSKNGGSFDSEIAAAARYDELAKAEFGEFAVLNGISMTDELRATVRPALRAHNTKITEDDVRAIRAMSGTLKDIAAEFGIGFANVSSIKRRVTWSHVK